MVENYEPFSEEEYNAILAQRKLIADLEQTAFSKLPPLPDDFEEFWTNVPLSDGWISQSLVVRPKPITVKDLNDLGQRRLRTFKSRPLIIYFFAGGFAAGTPPQVLLPARRFAMEFDATVLCPSYRLMPEYPWPQSTKDGMDFVQRVAADRTLHYGANMADGFLIAGSSAGGCIASAIAALVSANPKNYPLQHPLTALYASIPLLLVESIVPLEYKSMWISPVENVDHSGLESIAVNSVLHKLEPHEYTSPWFSPINLLAEAVKQSHGQNQSTSLACLAQNHPRTFVQANNKDPLRDDALIYEKLLAELGVTTKLQVFPDDAHLAYSTLSLLVEGKSRNPTIEEGTMEGMAWLLNREWPPTRTLQDHASPSGVSDSVRTGLGRSRSDNDQSNSGSSTYPNSIDTSP